jgi:hypothetical protein
MREKKEEVIIMTIRCGSENNFSEEVDKNK